MMLKRILLKAILPICFLLIGNQYVFAQSEKEAVQKVIQTLFDGMYAADSSMVNSTFASGVTMQTIAVDQNTGKPMVHTSKVQRFLHTVATHNKEELEEKILSYDIKIDGAMAHAWTPYKFIYKGKTSHCGTNSFQLVKSDKGWKIIYIVDTRGACEAGN